MDVMPETSVDAGPGNDQPGTASVERKAMIYFELEGGEIRKAREYNDTAHVFATLRAGQSAT
jgi:hypothetical protein